MYWLPFGNKDHWIRCYLWVWRSTFPGPKGGSESHVPLSQQLSVAFIRAVRGRELTFTVTDCDLWSLTLFLGFLLLFSMFASKYLWEDMYNLASRHTIGLCVAFKFPISWTESMQHKLSIVFNGENTNLFLWGLCYCSSSTCTIIIHLGNIDVEQLSIKF